MFLEKDVDVDDMVEIRASGLKHDFEGFQDLQGLCAYVRARQLPRRGINTRGPANPDVLSNSGNVVVRTDRYRRVRWRKCFDARFQKYSSISTLHSFSTLHGILAGVDLMLAQFA